MICKSVHNEDPGLVQALLAINHHHLHTVFSLLIKHAHTIAIIFHQNMGLFIIITLS